MKPVYTRSLASMPARAKTGDNIIRLQSWKPRRSRGAVPSVLNHARTENGPASDRNDHPLHILIVDNNPVDRQTMIEYLKTQGIGAKSSDESAVKQQLANGDYDLVTLDLSVCRNAGLSLLFEIRSRFNLPLIVTTPSDVSESLRAAALELAADDCIAKPFGLREFLARIHAILRRRNRRHSDPPARRSPSRPRCCRFGDWQIDRRLRQLTAPDGSCVPLTKGEYALLAAFLDAPMLTLSREHLLQATRLYEGSCDRSIDVQILRLRRKLTPKGEMQGIIRTVRGAGYMFMLPVE